MGGNRREGASKNRPAVAASRVHRQCVPDVVAAHLDHVKCLHRSDVAGTIEERVDLSRQIEVDPVVVGARRANRVIGCGWIEERWTNTGAQSDRPRELLYPRCTITEMMTAPRVRRARNEERTQCEIRRCARVADQGEGITRIRQTRSKDDNAGEA